MLPGVGTAVHSNSKLLVTYSTQHLTWNADIQPFADFPWSLLELQLVGSSCSPRAVSSCPLWTDRPSDHELPESPCWICLNLHAGPLVDVCMRPCLVTCFMGDVSTQWSGLIFEERVSLGSAHLSFRQLLMFILCTLCWEVEKAPKSALINF